MMVDNKHPTSSGTAAAADTQHVLVVLFRGSLSIGIIANKADVYQVWSKWRCRVKLYVVLDEENIDSL